MTDHNANLVVFVTSEGMGRGDDGLGQTLMGVFLDTLAQQRGTLTHLIFVNGGAQLTVEGSPVLAQLRQLAELDVELLTCGTCLNHFGTRDKLAVGSASNMVDIVELLSGAERIIRP